MEIKEIEQLHRCHLDLLDEFDRVCRILGVSYFLDSGTALGAVRHSGFIPWDDDVDVGMLRKDYVKFMREGQSVLSSKFFIQNRDTEPNYGKFGGKLRMNDTFFPDSSSVTFQHQGIYIDVYPFDYVSDDERKALRDIRMSRYFFRLIRLRDAKGDRKQLWKKILSCFLQLIPKNWLDDRFEQFCQKYNTIGTHHLTCYSYRMAASMDLVFRVESMVPTKYVKFEDRHYQIMNNPDDYLKTMYGDYMQLPPADKRVYHLKGNIVFNVEIESK